MGHHLLNGVKCVREVWGLTNALIISPSLFMDGGRKHWRRGNDRPPNGRHKLPQGGFKTTRSRLTPALTQQDAFTCVQTVTGNLDRKSELPFVTLSHFQTRKEGNALFSSKDLISYWQDMTCYLSYLSHEKQEKKKERCKLKSCFHTLLSWDRGWGRERGPGSAQEQSSITTRLFPRFAISGPDLIQEAFLFIFSVEFSDNICVQEELWPQNHNGSFELSICVALLIITAALKPAHVHLPCLLVIKRLHLSPVLSTSDAIQHCAPVQTAHTGSVLIHYSKQPSRSLIFSSTNRLIPHTINLPMSFEGMLTNQMHIQAQWIYSLVAICYGNTSYPQTKPVAEREFFFFFFFFSSFCFFSLISWCYSSVSISVSYSCGSAESEVECTQAWHKHNKGLVFLEKSMSPRWWRLFQVNYNVRCTDYATQRKKSWYADTQCFSLSTLFR